MSSFTRDPKGYYIALGIAEDADGESIKAAYRSKAKRLHPDFNPSPIAAKQFNRLHEAYATLSDPSKRAAYDRPWRTDTRADGRTEARTESSAKAKAGNPFSRQAQEQTQTRTQERPEPAEGERAGETARAATTTEQPAVCRCGKVTAQPRYIVFDLVWGRLNQVQRRAVSGVFCRSCADRTAVRTSLITWIAGWWAWPDGPRATVSALLNNIRGGRKPPERNAQLLMRHARAFRARGEMELARNAAEQALAFAATPALRREVDQLLLSLSSYPARPLKNRWGDPGWAATAQLMPLALMVAAVSMTVTLSGPASLAALTARAKPLFQFVAAPFRSLAAAVRPSPRDDHAAVGRVYRVAGDVASMRTGPAASYQLVAVLPQGALVLVTETDPSGTWFRVTTAEGASGFVAAKALSPTAHSDAVKDAGDTAKPPLMTPER